MRSSAPDLSVSIPELRDHLDGRAIAPADPEYDAARTAFYGGFDRRPGVIVRAAGSDDEDVVWSGSRHAVASEWRNGE